MSKCHFTGWKRRCSVAMVGFVESPLICFIIYKIKLRLALRKDEGIF